ncbi:hypothetical protein ACFOSC_00325 [Streptantibioticus rubrisoli]|uniref:Uncharacterized protein n=1 Tax=Streptantibioticus rubrisoli TaxID=1387313 RepID=A0ABT1PIF1_9ACTN|nr:hypothetical protein [Streptantibioticus rubrisoli]MCQ4045140.1 hypothetical protein [Streptantibioticus rubrisoli]
MTAAVIGFIAGTLGCLGWLRRLPTAVLARVVIGVAAGVVSAPQHGLRIRQRQWFGGASALITTFQAYGNSMLKAASLQRRVADPLGKALTIVLALTVPAGFSPGRLHRFPFV